MILLWQKHANRVGWLTGIRHEAACGGSRMRSPPAPVSKTGGRRLEPCHSCQLCDSSARPSVQGQ